MPVNPTEPIGPGNAGPSHEPHDPYAALRTPGYRFFAAGFFLSSTGLQMLAMAIGWEVYARTNSELLLGLTGLARALPVMLLALPAGHASDTFKRKWILVISQAGFALATAGLALWSRLEGALWIAYALLMVTGCVRAFAGPARGSLLPLIVPKADFQNAVTWNAGVFHACGVLGPLLGGWIIAKSGAAWPVYMCTAILTGAFSISAAFIRPMYEQKPAGKFTARAMLGGLGFVWRDKPVLGTILIDCLGVLLGGATALIPVYATEILHVGAVGQGVLRAAPYVGAVITAVYLAHRPPFKNAGRAFLLAVTMWALAIIAFGLSTNFYLSLFLLAAQGAIDNISVVIRHVLVQVRTPDELRGRVSAVNSMFIEISNELGAFESGAVAAWRGPVFSVVSGGCGTLAVVALIAAWIPELRKLKTLREEDAARL